MYTSDERTDEWRDRHRTCYTAVGLPHVMKPERGQVQNLPLPHRDLHPPGLPKLWIERQVWVQGIYCYPRHLKMHSKLIFYFIYYYLFDGLFSNNMQSCMMNFWLSNLHIYIYSDIYGIYLARVKVVLNLKLSISLYKLRSLIRFC